jgi:hypothetical protein
MEYLIARSMRAPNAGIGGFVRARARLAALGLLIAFGGGCAKRFAFTPKELDRVNTEADLQALRVFPSKRLIALYDESNVPENYAVNKQIVESSDKDQLKEIMTKDTAGFILEIEELNGKPLLWVTFEPSCADPSCAYGWVQTEDKHYRLVSAPKRTGYADPRLYRPCVWKRRRLAKGKLKSLAEANEVYLVKKRNGKILTVELQVKKVIDDRTKTRTRRARGVD